MRIKGGGDGTIDAVCPTSARKAQRVNGLGLGPRLIVCGAAEGQGPGRLREQRMGWLHAFISVHVNRNNSGDNRGWGKHRE